MLISLLLHILLLPTCCLLKTAAWKCLILQFGVWDGWWQYGGGRTIRPGESLETPQEKEAREARTKKLLDDYRRKMGLDIDPELKMQCEKVIGN
jgi:hypothetical protein